MRGSATEDEGSSSFRKEDFKKGISGKTQKRLDTQISIRKGKRDQKLLARRRDYQEPKASEFETYLNSFNPKALENGDLQSLQHLTHMIKIADEYQIGHHIMRHIMPYIPTLIRYCQTTDPSRLEYVECAMSCLVNLTYSQQELADKLAIEIFKCKFVSETIPTMLRLFHQGKNGCMSQKVRQRVWDVLSNLALTSQHAVADIMRSPIIDMGNPKSLFFQELFLLYDANLTNNDTRIGLVPYMVYLSLALSRWEAVKPPVKFCVGIWPFLQRMVLDIQPIHRQEMSPDMLYLCANLYNTIFAIMMTQNEYDKDNGEHQLIRMIMKTDTPSMLVRMREMMSVTTKQVQLFIVKIVGYMMYLEIGEGYMQKMMTQTGWTKLMVQFADNVDQNVRERALLFLGNFASDGTPYVLLLHDLGVISCAINKIKRDRYESVKARALFLFLKMFTACDADRRQCTGRIQTQAEGFMRTLIVEKSMFNYVLPFLIQPGAGKDLIRDALYILDTALRWNKQLVISQINDAGEDALHILLDRLNCSKGSNDTEIFDLACAVDDLLQNNTTTMGTNFEGNEFFGNYSF